MSDSISQMVSHIKNAYLAKKTEVVVPYSRFKGEVLKVLLNEGFLAKVEVKTLDSKKNFRVSLKYEEGAPVLSEIKVISKPGLRRYAKAKENQGFKGKLGQKIISTSSGVMIDKEAKKKGLGGEVVLEVY